MACGWKANWEDTQQHFIDWWHRRGLVLGGNPVAWDGLAQAQNDERAAVVDPGPAPDITFFYTHPEWRARSARWPERGVRFLATRFSAKEAFSKAIGLGMRMPMSWRLCEVGKLPSGKPTIVLHGGLKDWFEARSLTAHVSVTDETDYASSFCVVETI